MKKTIKIVSMSEYHATSGKQNSTVSTARKALVQGTLDIVSPRSPVQSFGSPMARSSASSVVSSRHSFAEDQHATPRRALPPPPSMHEAPQPERPSTSLELSDEDAEPPPVRPFADASNVPRTALQAPAGDEEGEDGEECQPFSIPRSDRPCVPSEEENRSAAADTAFKPPHSVRSLTAEDVKAADSGGRARNDSSVGSGAKKRKKKAARVVESRYAKPDSRKASTSFSVSSVGRPLFNSTSLDCSSGFTTPAADPHTRRPATVSRSERPAPKAKPAAARPKKEASLSDTARRPGVTSSCPAPPSGALVAQEELDLLYTTYIQYKFLNAATRDHECRQQQQFEAEFSVLTDAYRQRREKIELLQKELHYWRFVHSLEQSITEQIAALEPLLEAFPDFSRRFVAVCAALDSTRHRVQLRDLVLPSAEQLHEWQAALAADAEKATLLLDEVVTNSPMPADRVERLAELVGQLRESKLRHEQLFETARDIVGRAERLFTEEASLRVQQCQQGP